MIVLSLTHSLGFVVAATRALAAETKVNSLAKWATVVTVSQLAMAQTKEHFDYCSN